MARKYKLKIPDMIRKEDAKMADKLEGHSIVTSNSFGSDMFIQETQCSCKREWLEEIPDEPMSAEEFVKNQIHSQCREGGLWDTNSIKCLMIKAYKAGAAEERKKFRPQQSSGKIKDEPISAEEWAEQNYKNFDCLHDYIDYATRAFKAGAAENEKKHQLQQSFEEWWKKDRQGYPLGLSEIENKIAWQAHAKATNTEA